MSDHLSQSATWLGRWKCRLGFHDWEVGRRAWGSLMFPFKCRRCGKRKAVMA